MYNNKYCTVFVNRTILKHMYVNYACSQYQEKQEKAQSLIIVRSLTYQKDFYGIAVNYHDICLEEIYS